MRISKRALSVTATVLVALMVTAACTTSSVFRSEQAQDAEPLEQVDTDGLDGEPLETSAVALVDDPSPSRIHVSTSTNDGAVFDLFILEEFADYQPEQLGALQLVVSSYCLGLVDESSIDALTTDPDLQLRVLGIDQSTCDDVHRTALFVQGEPTAATTFEEALATRFGRAVWWYEMEDFRAQAERFCATQPTRGNFEAADADLDLSVSVEIELYTMVETGECDLPASLTESGGAESPAPEGSTAIWSDRFGGADGRAPLFATGTGGNCPAVDVQWASGFDVNIYMQSKDIEGIFEISDLALSSPLVSISSTMPREVAWDILTEEFEGSDVIDALTTEDVFSVFGLVLFGYDGPDEEGLASLIESLRSAPGVLLVTDGRCTDNATAQLIDG